MICLITGVTGFAGSHLADYLLSLGHTVHGTIRQRSRRENIAHLEGQITLHECDLRDLSSVETLFTKIHTDHIYHLAAQSFVPTSWNSPAETMTTNVIGQSNLFEAVLRAGLRPKIQIACSSEEYGMVLPDETPITEDNPLRPLSPYGVSKVAQDMMGYQYFKSHGMRIVRTRAFNHSVGRHTPVLLRDDRTGLVDIKFISELRSYKPTGYMGGDLLEDGTVLWNMQRHPVSVWANSKWSKIIHLSCHPLRDGDQVLRLVSSAGVVEVTGSHSVMVPGDCGPVTASAKDLSLGDRVHMVDLPNSDKMLMHEDMAWFLGFFAAEGSISCGRTTISNKDRPLLEHCSDVLLRHFGKDSSIRAEQDGMYRLCVRKSGEFSKWLRPQTYTRDGFQRVPQSILNSQEEAKLAFLRGYNAGDGLKAGHCNYEFKSFKSKSPILVLGLCYLIANTTRQRICLNTELRNDTVYYLMNLNSPDREHANWGSHLEVPEDILKKIEEVSYSGEVWDFETEDHVFHAGLGRNLVHNTGPRRGECFVTSNFCKQVAMIEKGLQEPMISVGNLAAVRDFTDARDTVRAYHLLLEHGVLGEVYNIASGVGTTIADMLDLILSFSDSKIEIRRDQTRMRPSDVQVLIGDCNRLRAATGWEPQIPFEQTMRDLLDYWRDRVCKR